LTYSPLSKALSSTVTLSLLLLATIILNAHGGAKTAFSGANSAPIAEKSLKIAENSLENAENSLKSGRKLLESAENSLERGSAFFHPGSSKNAAEWPEIGADNNNNGRKLLEKTENPLENTENLRENTENPVENAEKSRQNAPKSVENAPKAAENASGWLAHAAVSLNPTSEHRRFYSRDLFWAVFAACLAFALGDVAVGGDSCVRQWSGGSDFCVVGFVG
jgi:hypothetical protein